MGISVRRRRMRPRIEALDGRLLLAAGYTPAQVDAAYGFSQIALTTTSGAKVPGDGTGQTIAIIGAYHNPTLVSDLKVFSDAFGLPEAKVTVVNLGSDATNSTWASESAMDVQWAHALAPGASILLVEAASDSADDVLNAVDVARNTPGVSVVSMSFGFTETNGQHTYDDLFMTPAGHTGVTFVAASGDHGPEGGAMYPASSPNVLGVGGTSVSLDAAGNVLSESVWAKSGSGPGWYSTRPAYQAAFQQGTKRTTPDVIFLGDPTTGVQVYHTDPGQSQGTWRQLAGTSLGAPAWAALVAIANQGRALQGKETLNGASETLPMLYAQANDGFRQVTNTVSPTAAGLGAPNAQVLVPALVSSSTSPATLAPTKVASATPTSHRPIRRPFATRRTGPVAIRATPAPIRPGRIARQSGLIRRRSLVS